MGIKDFMARRADEYRQAKDDFELGCEIMGRPSDITSVMQRRDRMAAGKKERERRARIQALSAEAIRRTLREMSTKGPREVQFEADGIKVLAKAGYSRRTDSFTTDIILVDPGRNGKHLHLVISDTGNVLHEEWTSNH